MEHQPGTDPAPLDIDALCVARRAVENVLVDLRDTGISVIPSPGNGLVIRSADSPDPSPIVRLTTAEGLEIGIRAYLAALVARIQQRDADTEKR